MWTRRAACWRQPSILPGSSVSGALCLRSGPHWTCWGEHLARLHQLDLRLQRSVALLRLFQSSAFGGGEILINTLETSEARRNVREMGR